MASIKTLRPNALVSAAAQWTIGGGAASHVAATSDNSDFTASEVVNSGGADLLILDYGTYALLGVERCQSVRLKMKSQQSQADAWARLRIGVTDGPEDYFSDDGLGFPHDRIGTWLADPPGAATEWDQASIDGVRTVHRVATGASGFPYFGLYEAYVELNVLTAASTAVTSPTADQLTTPLPSVTWTYTGNGEAQKKFRVKVFTKAVAEGGGFNPETSANVYDSGEVTSGLANHTITTALTRNSEYYFYVKTAKDFNGADWWGAWSSGVRFKVDALPTTAVTAPVTPVANSSRPAVTFTYADTNAHVKRGHEVRIYLRPGGAWPGGFDPDTTSEVPVFSTGEVVSSALSVTPTVDLANNSNFRAYVRVQQDGGSTLPHEWSTWSFIEFNMTLTPPPVPLFAAVQDQANARITFTLTHQSGAVVPEYYDIEKSVDGVTWATVRGLSNIPHVAHGTVQTYYEYEAPFNKSIQYRAKSTDTSLGQPVSSFSASLARTLEIGRVWLKDIADAAQNTSIPVADEWAINTRRRVRSIREPLGRSLPVVLRGTQRGDIWGVTFSVKGQTTYDKLMYFLLADKTFLYQNSKRNAWVEVSGDITINESLWDELHGEPDGPIWTVSVTLIEVDAI